MAYKPEDCLCLENSGPATSTITLHSTVVDGNVYYAVGNTQDATWLEASYDTDTPIVLGYSGKVYIRGTGSSAGSIRFSCTLGDTNNLKLSGPLNAVLNNASGGSSLTCCEEFKEMFANLTNLVDISGLNPIDIADLPVAAFKDMFKNTKITSIPKNLFSLINSLNANCFEGMFSNTKITSIDKDLLPFTNLTNGCYSQMFAGCAELAELPVGLLPSGVLISNCYAGMFEGCTGLTVVPEGFLPPAEFADGCYAQLFKDCENLAEVNVNFTSWEAPAELLGVGDLPTASWLSGVASEGVFKVGNDELEEKYGADYVPTGWTFMGPPVEPRKGSVTFFGKYKGGITRI